MTWPGALGAVLKWLPPPTVTSVTTNTGPQAGGANVTIAGSGFTGCSGVLFDTNPATNVSVTNDGSMTCTTPAHAAGAVNVFVITPNSEGAGILVGGYTYV